MDSLDGKVRAFGERISSMRERGFYFYESVLEGSDAGWAEVGGHRLLNLSSYDYLGLIGYPPITKAAVEASTTWGTGTSGVRLISGTLPVHRILEARLAAFYGVGEALTFSSGYLTNIAVITAIVGAGDAVFCDRLDHASIIDGARLSGAAFFRFRHTDTRQLEALLEQNRARGTRLVVIDSVYSMDGDIANLPAIHSLCRAYGARLMIDESHALGVLGETGRGLPEHFGHRFEVDLVTGSLSKTIPSTGGYVAGVADLISYIRHTARPYVFSAALPPPSVCASAAALHVLESEPGRRQALACNTGVFRKAMASAGFAVAETGTPIIPIIMGDEESTLRMAARCRELGVFVVPILPPAVAPGSSRLRLIVTARHTSVDLRFAAEVLQRAASDLGNLGGS